MWRSVMQRRRLRKAIRNVRRRGFWFVDIPRTSSSSIRAELGRQFGDPYGKFNLVPEHRQLQSFEDHLPAVKVRELIGNAYWDNCFTFTIVRNPWDRLVSIFRYRERLGAIPKGLGFRDYVLQFRSPRYGNPLAAHFGHYYYFGMAEYVLDYDDRMLVDYIGRFETRERDLAVIADRIECPALGRIHLQRTNENGAHYSAMYDEETRQIVAEVFRRDIELFGYEFES